MTPPNRQASAESAGATFRVLVAAVLFLTVVPVGTAVFVLGFVHGDSPCVLCWQQRIGMALVALLGLFVLRYGPKPKYLGLAVLVAAYGVFMGLRHAGLHLARDVGQGFSIELFGAHTYTWSLFIFWCAIVVVGGLLMSVRPAAVAAASPRALRRVDHLAMGAFLVVMAGNLVQAFASTGPPPFVGQADPVRFSFNPAYWVWSLDEYHSRPVSLRGRWAIQKPDVALADPDPGRGPFRDLPRLAVVERRRLDLGVRGSPTGLAYDEPTDRFVLTTEHGVYLTDGALTQVVRGAVVDPLFAVDLGRFAGAVFLDSRTVAAVSENKSYVVLREADGTIDAVRGFRSFLDGRDQFEEISRSRLATVRAKMQYVMAAAVDDDRRALYTVTVPNDRHKRLIVSRFDTTDMTLSEEFVLSLAPDVAESVQDGDGALERVYVTGATAVGGYLYLMSAAHGTLLTVDLDARQVAAVLTVDGLVAPTGLALRRGRLFVVCADGTLVVVEGASRGAS